MNARMAMAAAARSVLKRAGVAAALCIGAGMLLAAGEPIKFSTTDKKLDAARPNANPLEKYLDRPFESLRPGNSLAPVRTPTMLLPTMQVALPEKDEREKTRWENSWIFSLPEDRSKQPTANEIFGVQRLGPDGQPVKEPTLLEKFMEQRNGRGQPQRGQNENLEGSSPDRDTENGLRKSDLLDQPANGDPLLRNERDRKSSGQERKQFRSVFDNENTAASFWDNPASRDSLRGDLSLEEYYRDNQASRENERLKNEKDESFQRMLQNRNFADMESAAGKEGMGGAPKSFLYDSPNGAPTSLRNLDLNSRPAAVRPPSLQNNSLLDSPSSFLMDRPYGHNLGSPQMVPSSLAPPANDPQRQRERPAVIPIPKRNAF